jgi:Ca2+-binding RTX toxin-like protein
MAFLGRACARFGAARRGAVVAAAVVLAFCAVPVSALAGQASVSGTQVLVSAGPAETNDLAVTLVGNGYRIEERGAGVGLSAGAGCTLESPGVVSCPAVATPHSIDVTAGDGDDVVVIDSTLSARVAGGEGDDSLVGGSGFDTLEGEDGEDTLEGGLGGDTQRGGPGVDTVSYAGRADQVIVALFFDGEDGEANEQDVVGTDVENVIGGDGGDVLFGSAGVNILDGGPGVDVVDGLEGADTLRGGADFDLAHYRGRTAPVTVRLDGVADDGEQGEGDNVDRDVEAILGGSGDDTLEGNPELNLLEGGAGADALDGGLGTDYLQGGDGNDRVYSRAGADDRDDISCGEGDDRVTADWSDITDGLCETLDVTEGPPRVRRKPFVETLWTPDPPPRVRISSAPVVVTPAGTAQVEVRCGQQALCKGTIKLELRVPRRGPGNPPPRKIVIGKERFSVPAGESRNVRVHLSRNGRRRVLRERNVRCSASAVTRAPDGDTKTTRRSITLVAPRADRRDEARK